MLKINSLLNPASEHDRYGFAHAVTPPTTPADSAHTFSPALTSQPATPITPSPKRQKRTKDAVIHQPGPIRGPVNYPPFESNEASICLTNSQQRELEMQHQAFKLQPSGYGKEGGMIAANVQHIPYSSDKRGFLDKTGRGGFDVFRYNFTVLIKNEKEDKYEERTFPVMWDYQVGLVRITPFYKACKYTKTIPNKSLLANPGLKQLSHSITGGSVEAQGYWVPYSCARALCLTFCYNIRWALTPIFGPSFIKECLAPDHPNYGRFKIDPEIVRISAMEQEGWRSDLTSRDPTLANAPEAGHEIPRSAPHHEHVHTGAQDDGKPKFKHGSPFSDRSSDRNYVYSSPMTESPGLSPKSKHRPLMPVQSPTWTSINRSGYDSPLSSRFESPSTPSTGPLLTKPTGLSPNVSWRDAQPVQQVAIPTITAPSTRMSTRRSVVDARALPARSSSNEGEVQPPQKKRKASKSKSSSCKRKSSSSSAAAPSQHKSKKRTAQPEWTEEDMNAARWLLHLHDQPKEFGATQGAKRKADDDR